MEQKEFVEAEPGSWWFIDPSSDVRWYEARRELSESRGWQEPYWLAEQTKLEELYKEIELKAPQLLRDLDYLRDTDDDRIAWIVSVREALAPAPAEAPAPAPAEAPASHHDEPAVEGAPEVKAAVAPEAPKKKAAGIFAKKLEQLEPQEEAAAPAPADVPPHVTEGVARVIESLSGEASSELAAELGVSEEDLAELANDPEFERMVHEEAAKLHLSQANG